MYLHVYRYIYVHTDLDTDIDIDTDVGNLFRNEGFDAHIRNLQEKTSLSPSSNQNNYI